jgi:SAM-dependent methyltransferase
MAKIIDRELLICPSCRTDKLSFDSSRILCGHCGQEYAVRKGNTYCFVEAPSPDVSFLGKIKENLRSFPRIYYFLINAISPVCPAGYFKLRNFLKNYIYENAGAVIINLGSGVSDVSDRVSNLDIYPYPNVNLTCDIKALPLKDESVDMILNIAVLEHVPEPERVVDEIFRILKPGGVIYCFFPFMQGFHAAPQDFSRRTSTGLQYLFRQFKNIEVQNVGGPTSALLWILEEWLALVFSLGFVPLYNLIHLLSMTLLWPLKFVDFVLIRHPKAKNISSGYALIAKK